MATAGNNLSSYKSEDLPNGAHFKVGIVVSEWNSTYTGGMLAGAQDVLRDAGVPDHSVAVHWVPGRLRAAPRSNGWPSATTSTASSALGL